MLMVNADCSHCHRPMKVERLGCSACGLSVEGSFDLPSLGRLTPEEQVFVVAFVRHHGSIRKMEQLFGISYPTVKGRLRTITAKLDGDYETPPSNMKTLEALERGEISVDEAMKRLH